MGWTAPAPRRRDAAFCLGVDITSLAGEQGVHFSDIPSACRIEPCSATAWRRVSCPSSTQWPGLYGTHLSRTRKWRLVTGLLGISLLPSTAAHGRYAARGLYARATAAGSLAIACR